MSLTSISLVNFGYFDDRILQRLAEDVGQEFHYKVVLKDGHMNLGEFYDAGRRQYNANQLLREVDIHYASISTKTLGLFSVDLFIPILTYIFGQAVLGGRSGIASAYRLGNERYGMKPDEALQLDRFSKEVIHELGHAFGLIHCHLPDCVMRASTYVEDIDQKSASLCPACRQQFESHGEPPHLRK